MEETEQEFEDMDLDDLSLWLVERDIPLEFCKLLKGISKNCLVCQIQVELSFMSLISRLCIEYHHKYFVVLFIGFVQPLLTT